MRTITIITLLILYSAVPLSFADDFLYDDWEILLQTCIQDGTINFDRLRENQELLDIFIHTISTVATERYEQWSRPEQLAFWLNAHNACVLRLLIMNPYARSVHDLREGPKHALFTMFGETVSLNHMKHTMIRGVFADERAHCALSSLARGFPALRNEAYLGAQLNLQLEEDVQRFMRNPQHVRIQPSQRIIHLSKILQWFGKDFILRYGTDNVDLRKFNVRERAVLNFLSKHVDPTLRDFILSGQYTVKYMKFDWTINRTDYIKLQAASDKLQAKK